MVTAAPLGAGSAEEVPVALARLHRSLAPGALVDVDLAPLPGPRRDDVVVGAGFRRRGRATPDAGPVRLERLRTLADTVGPGLRVLVCGLNPSLRAADAGVGFVTGGNRFWPAALAAGLVTTDRDPWHALTVDRVGMTDLVKRASPAADVLTAAEYAEGLARVERLCAWLSPGALVVVGLAGWRAAADRRAVAGPQERLVGGRPAYVLPSTSGRNAGTSATALVEHLRAAAALADAAS